MFKVSIMISEHDMKYDEFKERCHKAWSEKYNYLCIDMSKSKNKGNIVFSMKVKPDIYFLLYRKWTFWKHITLICVTIKP